MKNIRGAIRFGKETREQLFLLGISVVQKLQSTKKYFGQKVFSEIFRILVVILTFIELLFKGHNRTIFSRDFFDAIMFEKLFQLYWSMEQL